MWSKIKDQVRTITNNSDDDEKYMKINNINSDDDLPLNKTLELYNMTTVVRAVFLEDNRYYLQVFLDVCLYKF